MSAIHSPSYLHRRPAREPWTSRPVSPSPWLSSDGRPCVYRRPHIRRLTHSSVRAAIPRATLLRSSARLADRRCRRYAYVHRCRRDDCTPFHPVMQRNNFPSVCHLLSGRTPLVPPPSAKPTSTPSRHWHHRAPPRHHTFPFTAILSQAATDLAGAPSFLIARSSPVSATSYSSSFPPSSPSPFLSFHPAPTIKQSHHAIDADSADYHTDASPPPPHTTSSILPSLLLPSHRARAPKRTSSPLTSPCRPYWRCGICWIVGMEL